MRSYLSHLQCTDTGETYSADEPHSLSPGAQKVLYPRYDLDAVRREVDRASFAGRPRGMWRYFRADAGAGRIERRHARRGQHADAPRPQPGARARRPDAVHQGRGRQPDGFVQGSRAIAAVSRAKELGLMRLTAPSAGNALARRRRTALAGAWSATCSCPRTRRWPTRKRHRSRGRI